MNTIHSSYGSMARDNLGVFKYDKHFTVTRNDTSWLHMLSHTLDLQRCTNIQILAFNFDTQLCMFHKRTLKT